MEEEEEMESLDALLFVLELFLTVVFKIECLAIVGSDDINSSQLVAASLSFNDTLMLNPIG